MRAHLTQDQIEDLLEYIGVTNIGQWKGTKISFCCPIHGESHPSCGINSDFSPDDKPNDHYQVFHCFSCGASGTLPWFLYKSCPDQFRSFKQSVEFINNRYRVSLDYSMSSIINGVMHYDEFMYHLNSKDTRHVLPYSDLASFRSGKETYQYFFDRGFDAEDVRYFMIGRDLDYKTVTIPAFWEDGKLAGIIGRYIDKKRPKNSRFHIYSFPKGCLIYPLDKLRVIDGTIIGVESMIDAMLLHKWGYPNTIALMGDGMSKQQADQISARCNKFIALFDHDNGGEVATDLAIKRLGKKLMVLTPSYYPIKGKDPSDWGELETVKVIKSASLSGVSSIPRI